MDDIGAFSIWLVVVLLITTIGYLLWMLNRMRTPKEPVKAEPVESIAEVKGAGA